MKRRDWVLLMVLEALVLAGVAVFQHSPGYMDADYYTLMGQQLAHGTAAEPFLWNYLDDPRGVPHPGFAYWQPMAAAVAAWGIRLAGHGGFAAARWPFFALALLVPPLTALLAFRLTHKRALALLSGGLAVASGFYLPYLAVPDTFTPLMVLGALFFLVLGWPEALHPTDVLHPLRAGSRLVGRRLARWQPWVLGLLAGLMHLARAEGFLWLLAAWGGLALARRRRLSPYVQVLLGYAVVMLPWFWRNLAAFGAPVAPGGWRTLWLTNYNELYAYPASQLTFAHWWASGWKAIASARLHAAATNLTSALAVQGAVVWLPMALAGLWQMRADRRVRVGAGMWAVLWLLMSVVFPFSGARGGFFHAGAAVQPLLWAVAPAGLMAFLRPLARWRNWRLSEAFSVLGWGLVAAAALLSVLVVQRRVIGPLPTEPTWDDPARAYARYGKGLTALGVPADALVLVNNPPGFTLMTGHPSLAVPDGGSDVAAAVARRYGARYWVLEANHPRPLNHYYCHPPTVPPPWEFLGMVDRYTPAFVLGAAR